jgi:hypothetical protein
MSLRLLFTLFCLYFHLFAYADNKIYYDLVDDPIDVVIVTHPKDKATLDTCIDGIRENGSKIRRVIVVSSEKLTDKAEWFDEGRFPFSKEDVALAIVRGDKKKLEGFFLGKHRSPGWYFQQLLKLYSPFVIPDISSNVLIIDSDTIFMNPVEFLNDRHGGFFCFSREAAKPAYFRHAARLVPGYKRVYRQVYSVCHHMLFQRPILKDLFQTVEKYHKTEFWTAFCLCVDLKENKGASEFEIYYNYALRHTDQVQLRELKWTNSKDLNLMKKFKRQGYHFVSFHTYLRENPLADLFRK